MLGLHYSLTGVAIPIWSLFTYIWLNANAEVLSVCFCLLACFILWGARDPAIHAVGGSFIVNATPLSRSELIRAEGMRAN